MQYYLGVDCGSVSTKGVIINEDFKLINSSYTKNFELIESVKILLKNLKTNKTISGLGVTGSGKELVSLLLQSDLNESEIIAHYIAGKQYHPEVKTIFDIGGEDSKLMIINNHILTGFQMNRDCGGGTGAMIESIANRLKIPIEAVGSIALKSQSNVSIPGKCGVFAQSAVVSKLNHGVSREDILMGVCRGMIGNYLTMLAKGIKLNPPYLFQGATAKNKALIKCFEDELKEKIIIPKYPELMGALGIAILTKKYMAFNKNNKSNFSGFNCVKSDFKTTAFYGRGCANCCEITRIFENENIKGYIGNRCEKCIT